MAEPLIECVPNFSEGRRQEVIDAIAAVVRAVPDVALLGIESDSDHNRSVLTYEAAATRPERRNMVDVRRGEYGTVATQPGRRSGARTGFRAEPARCCRRD